MAKPSAIPNRLSLNASHYQSESSSIVEESNDFQKSDKNKVNTDHLAPLYKPSI